MEAVSHKKQAMIALAQSNHLDRSGMMAFFGFVLLLGGAPVAMRIAFAELDPLWLGFLRFGLAAIVFWLLVMFKGLKIPSGRALLGGVLYGVFGIGIAFVFLSWGLLKTPASLASIFLALIPLLTILLSALQGVEALTARGLFGALLSVLGAMIAIGAVSSTAEISLLHLGALVVGAVFLAQGGLVVRRFPANPPILTNAISMTVGAIILATASLVSGETWVIPSLPNTWMALGYLVFLASGAAFLLYLQVLNRWTASGTSYGFVVIPFITTAISALLSGEAVTLNLMLGILVVVSGVILGALLPHKASRVADCMPC